jgi:hypothetical protein
MPALRVPPRSLLEAATATNETAPPVPPRPARADPVQTLATIVDLSERLTKSFGNAIRIWPGGALSFAGMALLGASFLFEALVPGQLGALEFVTSAVLGFVLALTGPLVIARSLQQRDQVMKEVFDFQAWKDDVLAGLSIEGPPPLQGGGE